MATETQQRTLKQLCRDVERYAREIYGLGDKFLHECEVDVGDDYFFIRMEHC